MYEWNTAQNEPIMILMLGLLESTLSKPNINIIVLFQQKSIHTLENKVLMHQCAIAQRISKQKASPIPARSRASLLKIEYWTLKNEAQSALNIYFPHHFGCTSFADSIHSVSDLRVHLSFFQYLNLSWGSTNCLRFLLNLMNVQSSNIKIQSVGWYPLRDCALVHQHFIF